MPESQPTSSDALRVLIVEDDASNREVMRLVLESAGHDVSSASTGREALERAAQDYPDVVLLDLGLPDQSGESVARALRARSGPVPRIVITSGTALQEGDAARLGADVVLQKPFAPDDMLAALSKSGEFA